VGRERTLAVALTAISVAAPFVLALSVRAQQPMGTQAIKQEVPENLAEHLPPVQPIPYSHKTHLALGLECKACHTNPEPGKLMTFPATSTCMSCHAAVAKGKPAIQKLAAFAKSQEAVPWVRVYAVLPGVNWTHRKHLDAGMKCETCHGQVAQMDAMSETTSVTTMAVCISCHKANNAPTVCQTCHGWPAG
jgi:Cytochrome c7 and related cytochrome c/Class III cytochrome C family